jgi:hypothetical protein
MTEMRRAREIADVKRKLERIRRNRESIRAVGHMFRNYLGRGKSCLPATTILKTAQSTLLHKDRSPGSPPGDTLTLSVGFRS